VARQSDVLLGFAVSSERLLCIKQTLNPRSCQGKIRPTIFNQQQISSYAARDAIVNTKS
jgi:hypothetical protein